MNPDDINSSKQHAMQDADTDIRMILNILGVRHGDDAVVEVLSGLGLRRKQEGE